jgi:hypothetical protein
MVKLPGFYAGYWMDQHYDFKQEAISDPKQHYGFEYQEQRYRPSPAQFHCDHESDCARHNIAKRIEYRIALITYRKRFCTIAIYDETGIFQDLPAALDKNCDAKPPRHTRTRSAQRNQSRQRNAVQHMSETICIQQMLRIMDAPNVGRPWVILTANAPPSMRFYTLDCDDSKQNQCDYD